MSRYLIFFSYMGKTFKGIQRQLPGAFPRMDDPSTVQGRIETALKELNATNDPVITLSSRTDSGVHALSNSCHVDLHRPNFVYDPRSVTICLNKFFRKEDDPIRILKTVLVDNEFHCRHRAISRTYLYRFATYQDGKTRYLRVLPIEELDRCNFVGVTEFDVEKMKTASQFFKGWHDFRTFMGKGSKEPEKETRRVIDRIEIIDGGCKLYSPYSWPEITNTNTEEYHFYDVYVQSRGFLYRQVRRIVSSLIAVAQGKVSLSDIKLMLQVPSHRSWNERVTTVPAYGLYLCEVKYSGKDVAAFRESL